MIKIQKSSTADTRTCDVSKVTKDQLLESSLQHIEDVKKGIEFFKKKLDAAAFFHDYDKVTVDGLNAFYADFITGFKQTSWWDNHRKINRHHLTKEDGIPENIHLIDVLEMIVDCVMAGMGRAGNVYPLEISPELLKKAFDNTVDLLKNEVVVEEGELI
jgi:hypothetical protein